MTDWGPEGAQDASRPPPRLPAGALAALAASAVVTGGLSGVPVTQTSTMAEAPNSSEVQIDRWPGCEGWGCRRTLPDPTLGVKLQNASAIVEVCATGTPAGHP